MSALKAECDRLTSNNHNLVESIEELSCVCDEQREAFEQEQERLEAQVVQVDK